MHVIIIIHKNFSVKVGLNTKLTQSYSNILLTLFMIPKFSKFRIQFTINKMEGHIFSYLYLQKFLIYFHVFISKFCHFKIAFLLNYYFLSTWPCLHPLEWITKNNLKYYKVEFKIAQSKITYKSLGYNSIRYLKQQHKRNLFNYNKLLQLITNYVNL
jgi:hypothetical protein